MPVQIGAKSHSFSDPTGLLTDCHRRIEMFIRSLQAAGEVMGAPPSDEVRRALDAALTYFQHAAPKHTADEEASLFPRMRQISDPEVQSALAELEKLELDHRSSEPLHAQVERLGRKYLASGCLSLTELEHFRTAVTSLAAMYQQHIHLEDSVIFPLAARSLSEQQKTAIADEMAARRQIRGPRNPQEVANESCDARNCQVVPRNSAE